MAAGPRSAGTGRRRRVNLGFLQPGTQPLRGGGVKHPEGCKDSLFKAGYCTDRLWCGIIGSLWRLTEPGINLVWGAHSIAVLEGTELKVTICGKSESGKRKSFLGAIFNVGGF